MKSSVVNLCIINIICLFCNSGTVPNTGWPFVFCPHNTHYKIHVKGLLKQNTAHSTQHKNSMELYETPLLELLLATGDHQLHWSSVVVRHVVKIIIGDPCNILYNIQTRDTRA